ncbi:hypothetical protein ACFC09_36605 [Streptomyces sp. NPDC056161]|uniref:hypothetical protein n=1 Tax=Streptomyces sp. NPDC056161 TaxID=3345732 RepID=UPI0035D6978D
MTKNGANGPKSRARARKERSGAKYTQARRGAAAIPVTGDEVTLRSFTRGEPLPWSETVLSWQCHRCGAATDTCALVSNTGVVRLRPYCPGCLPPMENSPALRAFADYVRDLYHAAGTPCVAALAWQVEAVTGYPAAAAVNNVLTGTVLVRRDTAQALVHVLEGDVDRALQLWQEADREQSQVPGMTC